jgi:hypothetical protein
MIQSLAVALEKNYVRDRILTEKLVHQQIADPEFLKVVERAADAC